MRVSVKYGVALSVAAFLVAAVASASARATVDPGGRTVSVGAFQVQWSATDPEEITSLSWDGSPNLTNTWVHPFCPEGGAHEFFGNSWDGLNDVNFRALVGWGSTGTWGDQGPNGVAALSSLNAPPTLAPRYSPSNQAAAPADSPRQDRRREQRRPPQAA